MSDRIGEDPRQSPLGRYLEAEAGGMVGPEERVETSCADVLLFRDPYGSHRFVYFEAGRPRAVLQVVWREGGASPPVVAVAYTHPDFRRRGLATGLYRVACAHFRGEVAHSEWLSPSARAWVAGLDKEP